VATVLLIAEIIGASMGATALVLVVYVFAIRPWHLKWGATADEVRRSLPGDDLVRYPRYETTRGITINAPVAAVWPWLVQIGQSRGGFYSYDRLANLLGCDIISVGRIIPELQQLEVGDAVRMCREGRGLPALEVARVHPRRELVLRGGDRYSWAFVLDELNARTTRLLSRERGYCDPGWLAPFMYVEPIDFLMMRKMLKGIKERAERVAPRLLA
jgi:hypothetical protein